MSRALAAIAPTMGSPLRPAATATGESTRQLHQGTRPVPAATSPIRRHHGLPRGSAPPATKTSRKRITTTSSRLAVRHVTARMARVAPQEYQVRPSRRDARVATARQDCPPFTRRAATETVQPAMTLTTSESRMTGHHAPAATRTWQTTSAAPPLAPAATCSGRQGLSRPLLS